MTRALSVPVRARRAPRPAAAPAQAVPEASRTAAADEFAPTGTRIVFSVTRSGSIRLLRGYQGHLASRGWDVHVVASPGPELDRLMASHDGVTYHALSMAREPSPLADLRSLVQWMRLIRRLRPDVVSAGTPKAGMLGMVAAAVLRVPVRIYHQRGLRLETETGAKRRLLWMLERLTIRCSTRVLAVSHSLKGVLVRERLASASKVTVLGSGSSAGVDLQRFASVPATTDRDHRVVGFVGRVTPDKGLETLAHAIRILHDRGAAPTLLVVGDVEDPAALVPVRELMGRGVRVIATGGVADPAPYYQQMSVLCLPTRREGFPNVVLEAAASGIPAVTTTATGAVDSVVDGRTGFVVPVDDARAMADALAVLLDDPARAVEFGQAALERVREQFDRRKFWPMFDEFHSTMARRDP